MTFDDGSTLQVFDDGSTLATGAPDMGGGVFATDAAEANKMSGAYPSGANWWDSAATLGVSRVIDSATRAYTAIKGSQPATFAGQNGQTYVNGQASQPATAAGRLSPLVLVAGVVLLALALHKG